MTERFYLGQEDALAIHIDQIRLAGGASGVRDLGQLQSALYRPQTGYYPDLIAEAAALMESLAMNHPFVDGNKRVASAAVATFLFANGTRLNAPDKEVWKFIKGNLDDGTFTFDRIDAWLRENTEARK